MPLPPNDSLVTYPIGLLSDRSTVSYVTVGPEQTLLLTESTPFHPVDHRWPDQGADRGNMTIGGEQVPVLDCVIGATDGSALYVGDLIPVRRGEPGWAFVVVHVLPAGGTVVAEGDEVILTVDPAHRAALSAGHTGCHTAALALNGALAGRWGKPVSTDSLGHPYFDQIAISSSRIEPFASVDTYRIGRSLRKKGFDADGLAAALPEITAEINRQLTAWVASGAVVSVQASGPRLTDLREWVCQLPQGEARIPCGGTHLHSLGAVASISVELDFDAGQLAMRTTVRR